MKTSTDSQVRPPNNQTSAEGRPQQAPYLLFILLASVCALAILMAEVIVDEKSDAGQILQYADTTLCALFFVDFVVCFVKAKNKTKYFITWGWLDLISSIPALGILRWGRAARVVRILRVIRGIRSARILMRFILEQRAQSAAFAASLASIVIIAIASVAILQLEQSAGAAANIRTPEDALWWAIVTISTVGYGDRYPVTPEGRLLAAGVIMIGVGLIGTWAGIAASWFLSTDEEKQSEDIEVLRHEIRDLKNAILNTTESANRA